MSLTVGHFLSTIPNITLLAISKQLMPGDSVLCGVCCQEADDLRIAVRELSGPVGASHFFNGILCLRFIKVVARSFRGRKLGGLLPVFSFLPKEFEVLLL